MGTDNLHRKRKANSSTDLKRAKIERVPREAILIVCEDEKGGKYYLEAVVEDLGLTSVRVEWGGTPWPIVKLASKKMENYDRIYCVFDRDEHTDYERALDKIIAMQNSGKHIYAITSIPCFEYWILLHYVDSSKAYKKAGNKSAGDQLVSAVKTYIPDYHKAHKNIFELTKTRLKDTAIPRAKRINAQQREAETDNPSTRMHELIEHLMSLKSIR